MTNLVSALFLVSLSLLVSEKINAQKLITVQNSDSFSVEQATTLYLHSVQGMDITIRGVDSKTLDYQVFIQADEKGMLNNFGSGRLFHKIKDNYLELYFEPESSTTENESQSWIKQFFNSDNWGERKSRVIKQAKLTINVPKDLTTKVKTRYSSLDISDINGELNIENRSGSVKISKSTNKVTILNDYGNIDLSQVKGLTQITTRSSNVELNDIIGDISIEAPYSTILLNAIHGSVKTNNQSGTIKAKEIQGDFTHQGNYTKISLNGVTGKVQISNKSGNIDLENIGNFVFTGDYSDFRVENVLLDLPNSFSSRSNKADFRNVNGSLTIEATYADIKLDKLKGDLKVTSKYGSILGNSIKGDVEVRALNGEVDLADIESHQFYVENKNAAIRASFLNAPTSVTVKNNSGNALLKLLPNSVSKASLEVNSYPGAERISANIEHPFNKSEIVREIQIQDDIILEMVGKGSTELNVSVKYGKITIKY